MRTPTPPCLPRGPPTDKNKQGTYVGKQPQQGCGAGLLKVCAVWYRRTRANFIDGTQKRGQTAPLTPHEPLAERDAMTMEGKGE